MEAVRDDDCLDCRGCWVVFSWVAEPPLEEEALALVEGWLTVYLGALLIYSLTLMGVPWIPPMGLPTALVFSFGFAFGCWPTTEGLIMIFEFKFEIY